MPGAVPLKWADVIPEKLEGTPPARLAITHKYPAVVLRDGRLQRGRRGGRSHARLPSSPVVRRKRGRGMPSVRAVCSD